MSLTIYGPPQSRAMRALWIAHELGLEFDRDPGFGEDGASAALLAVNPMGQVPVIDDDGFLLAESMAINIYLAKKHALLAPKSLEEEAQTLRWSFWAMTAVEGTLLDALKKSRGLMGVAQDVAGAREDIESLERPFRVLDAFLADRDYLLGDAFSVADLNVASVLSWAGPAGVDFADRPNVAAWLSRCLSREAAVRARG